MTKEHRNRILIIIADTIRRLVKDDLSAEQCSSVVLGYATAFAQAAGVDHETVLAACSASYAGAASSAAPKTSGEPDGS
jgi:hypothetical protein